MSESPDTIERDAVSIGQAIVPVIERLRVANALRPLTESPIEVILGAELVIQSVAYPQYRIEPQYVWGRYRIDWAVLERETDKPLAFIECDGHDFHSSEEQLARDKARDDVCLAAGIRTFRFTGKEIHRSAEFCIDVVFTYLRGRPCP